MVKNVGLIWNFKEILGQHVNFWGLNRNKTFDIWGQVIIWKTSKISKVPLSNSWIWNLNWTKHTSTRVPSPTYLILFLFSFSLSLPKTAMWLFHISPSAPSFSIPESPLSLSLSLSLLSLSPPWLNVVHGAPVIINLHALAHWLPSAVKGPRLVGGPLDKPQWWHVSHNKPRPSRAILRRSRPRLRSTWAFL